tara:strand:+ start:936 stop:1316 length:381 start_codon:yes stop_codon:yes gene_type:complete
MKLILDLMVWFVKLIYLILVAILATLTKLLLKILTIIKSHFSQNSERGKTFVKAYYFLEALANNLAEIANDIASSLFETWSNPDAITKFSKELWLMPSIIMAEINYPLSRAPAQRASRDKYFETSA